MKIFALKKLPISKKKLSSFINFIRANNISNLVIIPTCSTLLTYLVCSEKLEMSGNF